MRVLARRHAVTVALAALFLLGLVLMSGYHFLLFHTLAELISIAIAGGIFVLAWNTRRFTDNGFLLVLGTAYLAVGAVDLIHALSYKGMGVFAGGTSDLPTRLWIAARYLQAVSIILACQALKRRVRAGAVAAGYAAVTGLLLWLIFRGLFPTCYVDGRGLTPFKVTSEYVICLVLLAGIVCLMTKRALLDVGVRRYVIASLVLTIASELAFTLYVDVYGFMNLTGHLLKLVAFYLIYKAIIEGGVRRPFSLLFRELKESEESLRRERDFVSGIFETARALIVVIDREGRIVRFNAACEELTGYSAEEAQGQYYWDLFVPPDEREGRRKLVAEVRAGRELGEFVSTWVNRDGRRRDIAWTVALTRDEQGDVEHGIACGIDMTERIRSERELRQAHEALQASENALRRERDFASSVLETAGALILVNDREGRIMQFNRACEELTGYREEEVRGQYYWDLISAPEDLEKRKRFFGERKAETPSGTPDIRDYETVWVTRDGRRRDLIWSVSIHPDGEGRPDYGIAVGIDITDRKRAERDLRQLLDEKELLLAEIQHRVKNNLQIIAGLLDLSRRRAESEDARQAIGDAQTKVHAMALIHDATYRATRLDQVDVGWYLRRLTRHLAEAYAPKDGHIRVAVDASESYLPLTQAVPCGLIINELVINAFQHAFVGRDRGEILVQVSISDDGAVTAVVRDDGIGMPTAPAGNHGTVLGVQLVRGLASQLEGIVEFAVNGGTEVTLRFQREQPASATPEAEAD